jgi:hypothetical protein
MVPATREVQMHVKDHLPRASLDIESQFVS